MDTLLFAFVAALILVTGLFLIMVPTIVGIIALISGNLWGLIGLFVGLVALFTGIIALNAS